MLCVVRFAVLFAAVMLASAGPRPAAGQESPSNRGSARARDRVGLLDVERAFHEYKRLEVLRAEFQGDLETLAAKVKYLADKIADIEKRLESGELDAESDEFARLEAEGEKLVLESRQIQASGQRDLMRKEAKIFHELHRDVLDAVRQIAGRHDITLVVQIGGGVVLGTAPPHAQREMDAELLYYRREREITGEVVAYLNARFAESVKTSPPAIEQTSGAAPADEKTDRPQDRRQKR